MEVFRMTKNKDVYAQSRYNKEYSPFQIYIPKTDLMFKMMRACVGVKQPRDLWFNQH